MQWFRDFFRNLRLIMLITSQKAILEKSALIISFGDTRVLTRIWWLSSFNFDFNLKFSTTLQKTRETPALEILILIRSFTAIKSGLRWFSVGRFKIQRTLLHYLFWIPVLSLVGKSICKKILYKICSQVWML